MNIWQLLCISTSKCMHWHVFEWSKTMKNFENYQKSTFFHLTHERHTEAHTKNIHFHIPINCVSLIIVILQTELCLLSLFSKSIYITLPECSYTQGKPEQTFFCIKIMNAKMINIWSLRNMPKFILLFFVVSLSALLQELGSLC